jgi:hypothetical protein
MPAGPVAFLIAALLTGAPAAASEAECMISVAAVASAPKFRDYPAPAERRFKPSEPRLASLDAKRYRTMLRLAAAKGANFAGHYTVADWGCGAGCIDFAIVDQRSGQVFFERSLRAIYGGAVGDEPDGEPPNWALRYRRDSRLLIVVGAPNEDPAREGVAFYNWTGGHLKLVRFAPKASACSPLE